MNICRCGCGQPVPLYIQKSGAFAGRAIRNRRYITGHGLIKRAQSQIGRPRPDMARGYALNTPIGSTRISLNRGNGVERPYRQVKVGPGRWKYEHRLVIERAIGRTLHRLEHVHHRNHDTLDNRPENLELLTASAHKALHNHVDGWSRKSTACRQCGTSSRPHRALELCTRCYGHATKPPRRWQRQAWGAVPKRRWRRGAPQRAP